VLNEGAAISRLLDSLAAQTRRPDEVVFVDGGSDDGTPDILQSAAQKGDLSFKVLVEPGANISRGRNVAIAAATGEVIASTDAGVRLSDGWLAALVKPFEAPDSPQVVSGVFAPDAQTAFEMAMSATVLPALSEINPATFLPSSRSVAFTRAAWQAAGGYPEWLDYCEDLVFDLRLRQVCPAFGFAPDAVAYFRPRSSMRSFFKQYYHYARGDGKADLWRRRHAIRYLTYLAALPLLVVLGAWLSPWWWIAGLAIAAVGHLGTPYRRLWPFLKTMRWRDRLYAVVLVPAIRVTGDVAKMIGYPVGLVWRWRRLRSQPAIRWR
jgi:glycosyltransferase involved in cell wall biosynthesis